MLTIRLQRVGRKNDPSFRVVVTDSKNGPQSGKFLEVVGAYDARKGKGKAILKADRLKHWMAVGASVSNTVHNLLVSKGVVSGDKREVRIPAKPEAPAPEPVVEAPLAEAPAEAESAPSEPETPAEAPAEMPAPEAPAEAEPVKAE